MDSQDGKGLLTLLFAVLVVFAVVWLAVPWLQKSGGLVPNETAAIGVLRSIHAAQADHFGASRMYGSMAKLAKAKFAAHSQDNFSSGGYQFSHSASGGGSTWCAVAVPETGKTGRTFGIDESGSVYEGVSNAACYMGTLNTTAAAVLK
jgi:hypothetical protein